MHLMLPYTYLFFLSCCSSTQAPRVSGHLPMYPELLQSHLKLLISSKQLPFTQGLGCNNNIRTYPCYTGVGLQATISSSQKVRLQTTVYCLHRGWTASNNIQFTKELDCKQQYTFYTGVGLPATNTVHTRVEMQATIYNLKTLDC
jgi:hypothetical protein